MKFRAPDNIGSVSLSGGTHRVVNGLIDVAEVSEADAVALKAFGFERYTAVEEGSFRRPAVERRPEGPADPAGGDERDEPGTDPAVTQDSEPESPLGEIPRFSQKQDAIDYALEVHGVDLDGRRSLKWMNEEITKLATQQGGQE